MAMDAKRRAGTCRCGTPIVAADGGFGQFCSMDCEDAAILRERTDKQHRKGQTMEKLQTPLGIADNVTRKAAR